MTIYEILCGKAGKYKGKDVPYFPGFVPLIMAYAHQVGFDDESLSTVQTYMDFLVKRASGEIKTGAAFIRDFVEKHPLYKQDSVVSDEIAYDLMMMCNDVGLGNKLAPELLGDIRIAPIRSESACNVPLSNLQLTGGSVQHLLSRYQ